MLLMGTTFCGDVGGETLDDALITDGDGVRGKVSAMLLNDDELFADETATTLLYLDGTTGGSSISCWNGVAVPMGINDFADFAIELSGRYGATDEIGLVTVVGGDGMWLVGPADDMPMIPLANFSKFKKSSVSLVVRSESP